MAETQVASVGYMGQFHLHNGSALYKLREVTSINPPERGGREEVESTHLESTGWRREHISTFYEDFTFDVTVNCRPLSDTDVLLDDAHADSDIRSFKMVWAENAIPTAQRTGTCKCLSYTRGEVTPDGLVTATATFRVVTINAVEAYSA